MATTKTRKSSKKFPMMTLCQAADQFIQFEKAGKVVCAVAQVDTRHQSNQKIWVVESAGMYWLYRVGEYNTNERYMNPAQVLRALGLGDNDKAIWRVVEDFPF